ncbi:hypothetical protein DTI93_09275 [Parasaccharibacter sp. TMW 2.1884]|uniref:hypothetical protein n=1 Tax=Parasaccharibacter sp. TMW 2.1884 TaxID=2267834 RepID=UPI002012200F|nr:hypothetical protein [Parasaccharibacter sp. TMW 2.1884]MCL1512572.1 hypothetical protein [Parasaccharibacter sp. TMW 2.1884]
MTGYGSLALLGGIATSLLGLIWYANRAGRDAEAVRHDATDIAQANQAARTTQAIAQAGASSPRDVTDLITELRAGKEGQL